jgi:LysR family nitrogen assimilation transcriptional regulator
VALRDLGRYPMIVPRQPQIVRMMLETQLGRHGSKLDVAWEVDGIPTIVDLVAQGFGHAVLPMNAIRNHPQRRKLQARAIVRPRLAIDLFLATSTSRPLTPLAARLAELARTLVARELPLPKQGAPRG